MPRYFFHTDLGDDTFTDGEGVELRDADQAWEAARAMADALLSEPQDQFRLISANLIVMDEAGEIVFELPFADVLAANVSASATLH